LAIIVLDPCLDSAGYILLESIRVLDDMAIPSR
jgi:hypothetical protein